MATAKVFISRGNQAIRLPKEFRVETTKVYLQRTRDGFLVFTKDPWNVFFDGIDELSNDFMKKAREQPKLEKRG